MRQLGVVLAMAVAMAACAGPVPAPSPIVSATANPIASLTSTATPAPAMSLSPQPSQPVPIPTPDASLSRPTPITARLDLSGPGGYRQTTSAVAGGGAIWVSLYQHVGAWLVRIDPVAGTVTRTSSLPDQLAPAEVAVGDDGTVWAAGPVGLSTGGESTPNGFVARIDPATGRIAAQTELPLWGQIDPGIGAVWVPSGSSLQRLDPVNLKVTATLPVVGGPATQCGLSATELGSTSTVHYLDPESGAVTATIDLGVDGHLLGNDPVEGTDNCWVLVGPPAGGDPATTGSSLAELALEPTMVIAGQSPLFRGDVRFAAGTFWLIANGTMTAIDPLTLAPLGSTWLLPSDISDPASWTLLGSGGTLWWVGPNEALRVGIPIPPREALGSIASQPWSGPLVPAAAAFSDLDHGILVGATGNGAGAGVVATTSDGGHTWTKRLLASPPLFGVTAQGSLVLATALCRIDAPPDCLPALLQSTDGGLTWTVTREGGLDGVQLASGDTAWATYNPTAHYAGVASSHDGGRTWRRYPSPCPPGFPVFEPTGISFPTAIEGWLACDGGGAMGSSAKALLHTTNGGVTWRTVFNQSLGGFGVTSGPANEALLGGDVTGINFLADGTGWLWTGDGLFATHDGGVSWQLLGFQNGAGGLQMNAMQLLTKTTALVLVTDGTTAPGHVTLQNTRDGGLTWTTIATWPLSP
jgi:hypothetical protein